MPQRFTPYAWAKMIYLRDKLDTEVSAFGVTALEDDGLIEDVVLFEQEVSAGSVDVEADAVNDMMAELDEQGIDPYRCTRVWIHTHPAGIGTPSGVDERTFKEEVFTGPDWAVMMIFPKDGEVYARLKINRGGPVGEYEYQPTVDWSAPFQASDAEQWDAEIAKFVKKKVFYGKKYTGGYSGGYWDSKRGEYVYGRREWDDFYGGF